MDQIEPKNSTALPEWLCTFVSDAADFVLGIDILAPLGCHCYENQARDEWEVTLFASKTQIVGGRLDGREVLSNFDVDVAAIMGLFDEPPRTYWQPLNKGQDDELGPHVSFEGTFLGKSIWLRVLAEPPARFGHGRNIHTRTMKLEDLW